MTKTKAGRVLVTSFDKFAIFTTLTFLVSVLLCHNLDLHILKCEVSLTQIITLALKSIMCRSNYMKDTTLPYFITISPTICQIKS